MAISSHHLFDTDESSLPQIRAWIRGLIGVWAKQVEGYQFIQTVDELCSNIIEHAEKRRVGSSGTISIELSLKGVEAKARVTYAGSEFDLTLFTPTDVGDIIKKGQNGGLGIRLINGMASKVEYYRENNLNVCTIRKKLAANKKAVA